MGKKGFTGKEIEGENTSSISMYEIIKKEKGLISLLWAMCPSGLGSEILRRS